MKKLINATNDDAFHNSFEKFFFGFEVQVHEPFTYARSLCDFLDAGRRIAFLRKRLESGCRDLLGTVLLAALIAGFGHFDALNDS